MNQTTIDPFQIVCVAGMLLSIFAAFTTETVANWIAPKKEGFFAIIRTIVSMAWMILGPFLCLCVALIFALFLALSR